MELRLKQKFVLWAIFSWISTIAISIAVNYFTDSEKNYFYRLIPIVIWLIFYCLWVCVSLSESKEELYYKKNIDHHIGIDEIQKWIKLEKEKIKQKKAELERKKTEIAIDEVDEILNQKNKK